LEEALDKRLETTGRWFITGQQFSSWKTQPDSLLWIRGKRVFVCMIDVISLTALTFPCSRVWKNHPEVSVC